jgi:phosphoglycerate kinase
MNQVPQLEDLPDPSGRSVLLRADFNVPIGPDGEIDDDLRIRAAIPTIQWLLDKGARVTACSHLGRPKGQPNPKYSMDPVRERLAELAPGVTLLENLRFDAGEEGNDPAFVARLVEGHDLYVNDAFGAAHRAHASIVGPPQTLPSAAGRLLAKEVEVLGRLLTDPAKPFVAVLGGSKVSDKLGVIEALLDKVDRILIGGGMCFTFFKAQGLSIGDSLLEDDQVDNARRLLETGKILLPEDVVGLSAEGEIGNPDAGGDTRMFSRGLPDGWKGLDIGPGAAAAFGEVINDARTVLWNGPMGVFEDPRFEAGTRAVAEACAETRGFTVVGGGDSASALAKFRLDDDIDHVSTGGGASLEFIENGDLPGLEALRKAPNAHG